MYERVIESLLGRAASEERALTNAKYGCPLELERLLASISRLSGADREPVRLVEEREDEYLDAIRQCVTARSFDRSPESLMRVCGLAAVMSVRFKAPIRKSSPVVEAIARVAAEEALRGAREGDLRQSHAYLAFLARALGASRSNKTVELPGGLGKEIADALRAVRCETARAEENRRGLEGVVRDLFV